jgi:DNA-binding PadR family transcriptional regulator
VALKKHWFHILLALAQGPAHGAEVRRRVRKNTDGSLEVYPAMLYGSLEDLLERGLIREVNEEGVRSPQATARYRYHDLTSEGRDVLGAEAEEYRTMAEIARGLLASGGET